MEDKKEDKVKNQEDKKIQNADPDFIDCDYPGYGIAKACEKAAKDMCLVKPLDVRWENWDRSCKDRDPNKPNICVICSNGISPLHVFEFKYRTGRKARHSLTQCSKCRTIFWK